MAAKTGTTATKAGAKKKTVAKSKAKAAAPAKAAKKKTAAPAKAARKKTAAPKKTKPVRVTLGSLSEQIATMNTELATVAQTLATLVAHLSPTSATALDAEAVAQPVAAVDYESFETDLLATMGKLDRSGRHAGLIPLPELRIAFLERGWARAAFDERLLQAERDFIVDLKVADDPLTLANPDLAIQERGRGYLQYAVAR